MRVLLSRKDTIKLLILSELVMSGGCNQKDIAEKLNLTPQAISEYFKELIAEGLVRAVHKGYYEATDKGTDWLTKNLFDLHLFSEDLLKKIYSRSLVAIAVGDIMEGNSVRYWFEDGLIYAKASEDSNGLALTSAKDGEDVLIKPIGDFRPPNRGEIIIVKVPDVCEGGSRKINVESLRNLIKGRPRSIVVAVGVEALVSCRKAGVEPIFFGAKDVCIEASHHGCGVIVVCTESLLNDLLRRLIEEDLKFEIWS
jgi:putative transcriptional regulator